MKGFAIAACVVLLLPGVSSADNRTSPPAIAFDAASVELADQCFVISWHASRLRTVKVYALTRPDGGEKDRPVASGAGSGRTTVCGLPSRIRWYFKLVGNSGHPLVVADRSLHLTSASNFRDVGGYRTLDGKWVRMGVAYRSNGLAALTTQEVGQLQALDLHLICDLRLEEERRKQPDVSIPGTQVATANVAEDSGHRVTVLPLLTAAGDDAAVMNFMKGAYRDFVYLPSARRGYAALLRRLADPDSLPTVFHCTAGKDRTGWAQAILLSILRVPRATIIEDYVLTDRSMSPGAVEQIRRMLPNADVTMTRALLAADPVLLQTAFREVDLRYGSFDNYVRQGLGLDARTIEALRSNFWVD